PPTGMAASVGLVLVLVGALSKSAIVPLHFWLPGAMAAPTPVSAYLHAAAMVKAGVYLIARMAPGFADSPIWRPTVLSPSWLTVPKARISLRSYSRTARQPASSRRAATQALLVTTFGGLAMLVGIVVLGNVAGTYLLSELIAAPPTGMAASVGLVLVLVGALSKSAIVPLHFWLPGAMAAPTPVSAYLHAAAMVKAGVYLIARMAPGFADSPIWRPTVLSLGVLTVPKARISLRSYSRTARQPASS
ncbi:proton-conducting transporter membrane subunit, partial [Mycolicibacterium elephantis]|uniref:proton-conducting transporter transmembrane domain-containing protein n=1 Tax=Mycolicibacterium elephantis TaxID=81858 RepID=UPI000AF23D71